MRQIENLHDATPSEYEGYQSWNRAAHGVDGFVKYSSAFTKEAPNRREGP